MKRNALNYSEITDTVYWVNGIGQKQDVTQNFIQMMLLYLNQATLPKVGNGSERELKVNKKVHWKVSCKRIAE